jgi:hypothetical protein
MPSQEESEYEGDLSESSAFESDQSDDSVPPESDATGKQGPDAGKRAGKDVPQQQKSTGITYETYSPVWLTGRLFPVRPGGLMHVVSRHINCRARDSTLNRGQAVRNAAARISLLEPRYQSRRTACSTPTCNSTPRRSPGQQQRCTYPLFR